MVVRKIIEKYSKLILIIVLLLTILFGYFVPKISFDYDFEKFFPSKDEDTKFYFKHREIYQSDNDFLLIAIENSKGVFSIPFLNKVEKLRNEISKLKYVTFVRSITSENELFLLTGGAIGKKPYYSKSSDMLKSDSTRIYQHKEIVNNLISKDGKSLCLFIKHQDFLPGVKSKILINKIIEIDKKFSFEKTRIAGRTIGQKYYIEKMTFELMLFVSISMILVVLFLWIAFRSLWGILLPQIAIVISLLLILGGMSILNIPINIILSMLPTIIFVVGMSDVIHIVSKFLDALREGQTKIDAIIYTIKEVGFATLLTSLTTAIGFYTLIYINLQPIQSFGKVIGTSVLLTFVITIVFLPVVFYIFPTPKKITQKNHIPLWTKWLRKMFLVILYKRKMILYLFGFITMFFLIFVFQIETNNYMMDDLKDSEPIKKDFAYLDQHYGGVRPLELAIKIKGEQDCWDLNVLREAEKLENYLEKYYKAKINLSLVSYLKVLNQSAHSGQQEYYKLPSTEREIKRFRRPIKLAEKGKLFKIIVDSTQKNMRISASIGDLGNNKVKELNNKFLRYIKKNIDHSLIKIKITGTAHLLDKNMSYLSGSLMQGILVSILIITFLMGIVYQSFSMVIISLIPNLIPLVVLGGLMGLMDIHLRVSTSIIFTIAFGIAVDDTIHFLSKFRIELAKGKSKLLALKSTFLTTGKAMILTTLILCSGFLMLLFSGFLGTFIMGLMISITLFVALLADLFLLPVLLLLFYHPKSSKVLDKP
ncbi:MAG: MMPL family transporter [Flavobacteriia bacterium]|nr:MMPL family transporter [Flavobacteriia bacterium]